MFNWMKSIVILLWRECILLSNPERLEVDRGLWTLVSGIILVIRDAVGEKFDRVGLVIYSFLILNWNKKKVSDNRL